MNCAVQDHIWLAKFNSQSRQPLIDEDRLEGLLDCLEKASFRALHGATTQRPIQPHLPSASTASSFEPVWNPDIQYLQFDIQRMCSCELNPSRCCVRTQTIPLSTAVAPQRRDVKRPSAGMSSFTRAPKSLRPSKLERPPPPSDHELLRLPSGLCRRYQQGRCHKGRSCKWKHEIWPELKERWDTWRNSGSPAVEDCVTSLSVSSEPHTVPPADVPFAAEQTIVALEPHIGHPLEDRSFSDLGISSISSAFESMPPSARWPFGYSQPSLLHLCLLKGASVVAFRLPQR